MSQYIPVNLAYTSYEPAGGADDTLSPIIFLHGVTGLKEMWFNVPQMIADKTKRKAYAVDSRNHGDTEWTDEFNFDINVDDLLHFMDNISASKAVLVGHSMGGITSVKAALRSPQRIEMVFVEDMYVKRLSDEILDMISTYASLLKEAVCHLPADCTEEDVVGEILDYMIEKVPALSNNLSTPEAMATFQLSLKKDSDGRYQVKANLDGIAKGINKRDSITKDPKGLYEGPAYFIYGTVSPCKVYEDEENIKKFFPKAELIGIENADHYIHFQFPGQFIDIVAHNILKE